VRRIFIITTLAVVAFVLFVGAGSQAQTPAPSATKSASATLVAKIVAIDQSNRVVTLQDAKGNVQSIQVGPSVTRFDALKVGDTVTFVYSESVATSIVKPGTAMPSASSSPTVTRFTGQKPGGQISQTVTTTVTIKSIDMSTPSVTVVGQNGKTVSLLVQDKNNLTGLKPGDVVQLTYTQTLTITVK
jgi:Cu/Ag efflux protein CusF